MTHEQRTAMARIISDMIKADNIIEESEIRDMKELMSYYSLTRQDMSDARNIRFSNAVTILQELGLRERKTFFENVYKIAISDNVCVPKEALLLIALQYCLIGKKQKDSKGNSYPKPYLLSCPTSEVSLNDQYMVYLEGAYDEERNEEIKQNFELLVTRSRLYGFNFVYIPKMVEEFENMDSQYVKDVISYMAPHLSQEVVADVYGRLCKMTTATFFHNVLYERLQVKALYDAKPSLLINIGTSVVPYCTEVGNVQYYTEFLCIPIVNSTLSLVKEVLDFYKSKVSLRTITVMDNNGQFKYFGFYKALFDFLIAPPPVAPDLIFLGQDLKTGKYNVAFKFEEGRERILHLTPKRYALYHDVAMRTFSSNSKGYPCAKVDKTTMSHLRRNIGDELKDVSFVEQYKPEKEGNCYILRINKEKVFVRRYENGAGKGHKDVPIYGL